MARCGIVRADHPGFLMGGRLPGMDEIQEKMGLDQSQGEALNTRMGEFQGALAGQLQEIFVEAGGSLEDAQGWSPKELMAQIKGRLRKEQRYETQRYEIARVLAEERAGLRQAPTELGGLSTAEKFLRVSFGLGDQLEQSLAEAIGPDLAREFRSIEDGWPGSTWTISGTCRD